MLPTHPKGAKLVRAELAGSQVPPTSSHPRLSVCLAHGLEDQEGWGGRARGADRESTQGRKLPGLFLHDGSPVPGCPQPPCRSLITETDPRDLGKD